MALTSVKLQNSTAANIVYGTSTQQKAVTALYLCNVLGTTVAANVYLVPAGSTVADCLIYSNVQIAATDTHISDTERIILGAGDSIWANCSTNNGIVMTVSTAAV
jgi:hypothetical protein